MPAYVDKFGDKSKNFLRLQYELALAKVSLGAIAVGEAHDTPYARAVVCDLIEAGYVEKLFLELKSLSSEQKIRGDLLGKDVTDQQMLMLALKFMVQHDNPIPMSELLPLAVKNSVLVYCYDTAKPADPTSPQGMKERNYAMGDVFKEYAKGTEPKVVALMGRDHIRASPSGGHYQHTVQHICGIPFHHVMDLSMEKLAS